jgi:hypothetical protein
MVGKLSAVVGGNRENSASMRVQALDYLLLHGRGGFVSYLAEQSKLAFAFDGTDDRATMVFADDGVGLPIADTFFGGDDLWSLFDTNAIRDFTAEIVFSVAFAFFLMAGDAELLVEPSAVGLVLPDMLVDTLVTDGMTDIVGIDFHSAGDLFRRVFLTDLTFDIGNRLGRHFNRLAGVLTALLGPAVRLFGPIAALAGIAGQFPADGAGVHGQALGDGLLWFSSLLHGIDFDTIFLGELLVLSHNRSV